MKKQIASIFFAILLGITIMFAPIVAYTQLINQGQSEGTLNQEDMKTDTYRSLNEAAQTLGKNDLGSTFITQNLLQILLLVVATSAAALAISVRIRKKIGFPTVTSK
jgi:hypothetical protein